MFNEGAISNHGIFDDMLFEVDKADVPTSSGLMLDGKMAIGKSKVSTQALLT